MKAKALTIQNIGLITDERIEFNLPLILFYGEIMQGKSTILKAVRWVCGGEFPQDIIQNGKREAKIMLEFDGGMIARSWYKNDKDETVARPVAFIRDGKPVPKPVAEISRLLNPFLLDQDHLVKKEGVERKRFFTELFGVDTTDLDKQIFNKTTEASSLRSKISGYGVIDVTPVPKEDVAQLESELESIRASNNSIEATYNAELQAVREHNATHDRGVESRKTQQEEIDRLKKQLSDAEAKLAATNKWLNDHPRKEDPKRTALQSTASHEAKLREAGAQNVRHEQYLANVERNNKKVEDQKKLTALESEIRSLRDEKIARLKNLNDNCKIKGLKFDENGNFSYHGTNSEMLSTSQLMTLSSELSALYPEGLGIELLDKAESLGRSIFTFVKRAEDEGKTILATIVGEKPATVPEKIGVFVVEGGKIK